MELHSAELQPTRAGVPWDPDSPPDVMAVVECAAIAGALTSGTNESLSPAWEGLKCGFFPEEEIDGGVGLFVTLVDRDDDNPPDEVVPWRYAQISAEDIRSGAWRLNDEHVSLTLSLNQRSNETTVVATAVTVQDRDGGAWDEDGTPPDLSVWLRCGDKEVISDAVEGWEVAISDTRCLIPTEELLLNGVQFRVTDSDAKEYVVPHNRVFLRIPNETSGIIDAGPIFGAKALFFLFERGEVATLCD